MISLPYNWSNKKVLVTGAGGFIGSHLTESLLMKGCKIKALVKYNSRNDWGLLESLPKNIRSEIEVVTGDITDPFGVDKLVAGNEVIFHLAALIAIPFSYVAPEMYVNVNIKGTLNVLEACRRHNVEKLIHTSTSETYGTALYTPIDENHPLQGQSPYSATKIAADKLVESYYRSFNLPVATIRPFNTYGPRQSARAVIPTIISQALSGDTVNLGNLTPVRDLNYVQDSVNAFIKIAESSSVFGETINIGFGKGITIGELANKILQIMNSKAKIICADERLRPEKSEVFQLICNNEKAKTLVGWQPGYSLEQGLTETISYITLNLSKYKTEIYNV